jgi:hypothetical protein
VTRRVPALGVLQWPSVDGVESEPVEEPHDRFDREPVFASCADRDAVGGSFGAPVLFELVVAELIEALDHCSPARFIDAMNYWQPVDGDDPELTTAPDGTSMIVQEHFPSARKNRYGSPEPDTFRSTRDRGQDHVPRRVHELPAVVRRC